MRGHARASARAAEEEADASESPVARARDRRASPVISGNRAFAAALAVVLLLLGRLAPAQGLIPIEEIVRVSAGGSHTCALTAAGGVKCWGDNSSGQLGNNSILTQSVPVDVVGLASGVAAIEAGASHTCAVTNSGGLKCWGSNSFGQLGDNTGQNQLTPVDVSGLGSGVIAVAAGARHTCALTGAGGVKCWGDNATGQLGDGTTTPALVPLDVTGLDSGVTAVAAGGSHSCAVTSAGGVKCWGDKDSGQLGINSTADQSLPVDVSGLASGISVIAAGSDHTCALDTTGGMKCWGLNGSGQLGNNSTSTALEPVDVSGLAGGVDVIATGNFHTCARSDAGGALCWGDNSFGQLGNGSNVPEMVPVDVQALTAGVVGVSAGGGHSCAVTSEGGAQCWGGNLTRQLGNDSGANVLAPVVVGGAEGSAVAAGADHTCTMGPLGGAQCWGRNHAGQLGDGSTIPRLAPVNVTGLPSNVAAIAAGGAHTCALASTGGVMCWGANDAGQLGDGTTNQRLTPVDVVGLAAGVVEIAAGERHSCARTATAVKCWGANDFGQLGDGTTTQRLTPVDVVGLMSGMPAKRAVSHAAKGAALILLATGRLHTCAQADTGVLKCWGDNSSGQLGDGSTVQRSTPVDVVGFAEFSAVAAGGAHTCARDSTPGLKCWGSNSSGQLGDDSTVDRLIPVDVVGLAINVGAIATGQSHTCAAIVGGGLRCWGANASGQLGIGSTVPQSAPADVAGIAGGIRAALGSGHSCSHSAVGLQCWGGNEFGQLGLGPASARPYPLPVLTSANSGTTLQATPSPSLYARPITLTATVQFNGVAGSGDVDFKLGGAPLEGCTAQPLSVVGRSGTAECVTSALLVGTHQLSAEYPGDGFFPGSTSGSIAQVVGPPPVALAPESLPGARTGAPYLQQIAASGLGTSAPYTYVRVAGLGNLPVGLVLEDDGRIKGTVAAPTTASFTIRATDASSVPIGGPFTGERAYTLSVTRQSTSTSMGTISPSPSLMNQPYTVPVVVTGEITQPDGSVTVIDGTGGLCTFFLNPGPGPSQSSGSCDLVSSIAGTKTITASFGTQTNWSSSQATRSHTVNTADNPPTLTFNPAPTTQVPLSPTGAATIGSPASAAIPVIAINATGSGSTALSCNVLDAGFSTPVVTGSPFSVSSASGQIQLGCTIVASPRSGTLNCQVQPSTGAPISQQWPITCPAAADVAPTLAYTPAPGLDIRFADGALNAQVQTSIDVSGSGAVGNGSTSISGCGVAGGQAGAFTFLSGHQTVSATQSAVPLQLRCTVGLQQRGTTLTCTETSSPGSAAQRQWPLTCPPASSGTLKVGRRFGVPGGRVVVPITFARDATPINRFNGRIQFATNLATSPLGVVSVVGANGATCARLAPPDANQIAVDWGSQSGPVAATTDTRYCEVTFAIAANAAVGPNALPVFGSNCIDTSNTSTPCGTQSGQVSITAMDPSLPVNTPIVIVGREGQASTTLQVTNRSNAVAQLQSCQIAPPVAALWVQAPSAYPVVMQPNQPVDVTLGCMLPALGQTLTSALTCGTSDAIRPQLAWDLHCTTVAAGMALAGPPVYDPEERQVELLGSAIARGQSSGQSITVVGAPAGGGDGNGRVAVFTGTELSGGQATDDNKQIPAKALDGAAASGVSRFGHAVAIKPDGSAIAVGAPFDDPNPNPGVAGPGRVYVYARPPAGWSGFDSRTATPLQPPLDPPASGGTPLEFGAALAYTAAGELVVGAPGTQVGVPNVGRVFVFDANRQSRGAVISPNEVGNGRFGSAVAVMGDQVLIGAPGELAAGIRTGAAYRLTLSAQSIGSPARIVPGTTLNADALYGTAIAANDDLIVVGAPGDDTTAGTDSGSAIVFTNPTNPSQVSRLLPGTGNGQAAGQSLAIDASQIFVGAPNGDLPGRSNVGRVYVYPIGATFAALEMPLGALENASGTANDRFGAAIAADAAGVVVGVPEADLTLSDGITNITNMGRLEPFVRDQLDLLFGSGFEN